MNVSQRVPPGGRGPVARGMGDAPRAALSRALGASLVLHTLALLALEQWVAPPLPEPERPAGVLTVELEPLPPPEILKNTLAPEPQRPRERPGAAAVRLEARESGAGPRNAPRAGPPEAVDVPLGYAPKPPPEYAERLPDTQLGEVMGRLSHTLLYPPEALRRGLEGEVVLLLELGEGGRVLEATVASSSGHPLLDEAALRAASRLGSIAPASAGKAILLPVRFRIL